MKKLTKVLVILLVLISILTLPPLVIQVPDAEYNTPQQANSSIPEYGKYVTVNNVMLYVEDLNSESDKVITFIHGFGGSTYSWRENKQFFADNGYRVVAIDLKGFGLSQKGIDLDYSHVSQAETVKEVLNYLLINKTVVVGHSMGGNVATIFTQNYPDMVSNLVLVDAAVNDIPTSSISKLAGVFPVKDWLKIIINGYITKDRFKSFLESAYVNLSVVTDTVVDNYYLPLRIQGWQDSLIGMVRDGSNSAIPYSLSTIQTPTLILWGDMDPWVNISKGTDLNAKIPNSAFIKIENAGHLPMEENPSTFNSTVLQYLVGQE